MSLKTLLTPLVTERMFSATRLQNLRAKAERKRLQGGKPHQVFYFHQVDDPYSLLLAQQLPKLLARYQIDLTCHLVGAPSASAAPEREMLTQHSRKEAALLSARYTLGFADPGLQPGAEALQEASAKLAAALQNGQFTRLAGPLCGHL